MRLDSDNNNKPVCHNVPAMCDYTASSQYWHTTMYIA